MATAGDDSGAPPADAPRVLYIGGIGANPTGTKPQLLRRHFAHVSVPAVKHASYVAAKESLSKAVTEFRPDIVVAHAAGVGKALTLAAAGVWKGPMLLLAGGGSCGPIANVVGQAVTVVVPSRDAEAKQQRRSVKACADLALVALVDADDNSDLNTFLVDGDRLRGLVLETFARQQTARESGAAPAAAEGGPAEGSANVREQVRRLFSDAGTSLDAGLTRADLAATFDGLDASLDDDAVDGIMAAADADADGLVGFSDVVAWAEAGGDLADRVLCEAAALSVPPTPAGAGAGEVEEDEEEPPPPAGEPGEADEGATAESSDAAVAPPAALSGAESEVGASPPGGGQNAGSDMAARGGQLFTWGRGSEGQLGQDRVVHPKPNCALPHPVRGFRNVVHVACGGGQQGCTAAVTSSGQLFTFGNNAKGRLGHGEGPALREPRLVEALADEFVLSAACGSDHSAALVRGGRVFTWGGNRRGQLGLGQVGAGATIPTEVQLPAAARQVDCEELYSAAVLEDGRLLSWGGNDHGQLGVGHERECRLPCEALVPMPVTSVALGSLYAGAVGAGGELLMWGYGGHGNLGLGNRKSVSVPTRVPLAEPAAQVACTRGQSGCKGGLNPTSGGFEGPHTVVLGASGAMYTMGTCHKGLLCNLGSKDGAFGKPWDELQPYKVGGPLRNDSKDPPISPLAVWPPPYDSVGPQGMVVSAHIHAASVGLDGRAWAWGCGSNDGRCGVERFLNMKGEGRPPEVDAMKCYMMGPHRIGVARPLYWKHPSLRGHRVLMLASGRNHMACVAVPDADVDAATA